MTGYLYIAATILLTVYGQVVLKWRITDFGPMPEVTREKIWFIAQALFDPFIFSGLVGAFMASLFWMAAMTKFDLSYAFPFTTLSFVLVMVLSALLFHEPLTWHKIVGMLLIIAGIIISAQSVS